MAAPGNEPEPAVLAVYHTGVTVTNLERSLRFYRDLLGLEVVATRTAREPYILRLVDAPQATLEIALLRVPGGQHLVELLEYVNIERAPVTSRPRDPGTAHLCFYVRNLAGMYSRLMSAGIEALSEPLTATAGRNAGATIVYVRDPDGFWVELIDDPNHSSHPVRVGAEGLEPRSAR